MPIDVTALQTEITSWTEDSGQGDDGTIYDDTTWAAIRAAIGKAGLNIASKSGAYTATDTDTVILGNVSLGGWTLTLPAAATSGGFAYHVKKVDSSANALTINPNASETIDGQTTLALTGDQEAVTIVCDGSNWRVVARNLLDGSGDVSIPLTGATLTAPDLGTPSAVVLTNATGLPLAGLAGGTDGELITWDAAGVPATVDAGATGQVLTSNGAGAPPTMQTLAASPVTAYVVTVADVANTVAETTSMSISVDDMADGDIIHMVGAYLIKNNKGTTGDVVYKLYWGASASAALDGSGNGTLANNAGEGSRIMGVYMMRVGSDLWVAVDHNDLSKGFAANQVPVAPSGQNATQLTNIVVISAPTFGSAQTVALKITLDAADVTFYANAQSGRAYRYGT